jgi:hypothetical protein
MTKYFLIKAKAKSTRATIFQFYNQKTMYAGKTIAPGDTVFIFDSEHEGGRGLIARGVVTSASPSPRKPGLERQTPRVSLTVRRTGVAKMTLGRTELRAFSNWQDGRPETELNFKFYRQATNKLGGISPKAAAFLDKFF